MSIYLVSAFFIFVLLQSVEGEDEHPKNQNTCNSELLAEFKKMQKKVGVMEEQISRLTKSNTGDCTKCDRGTYMMHGIHGVKVPSTSSLSVYTKVLAHNLNDIRNWAALIGLLLRICWCLLSVFLIYCSDEWKKLVNLIYCFQVLFRMNFKIMYCFNENLGNYPLRRQCSISGFPFFSKCNMRYCFFLLILLMTH